MNDLTDVLLFTPAVLCLIGGWMAGRVFATAGRAASEMTDANCSLEESHRLVRTLLIAVVGQWTCNLIGIAAGIAYAVWASYNTGWLP